MLFTDLRELKSLLEIDLGDASEDKKLSFLIPIATDWMGEWLNRPNFTKKERTEYYDGSGTDKLRLKNRPVYTTPTIQCWVDRSGYFGQTSGGFDTNEALTYGDNFVLKIDTEDDTSRSALLIRRDDFWPKRTVRQGGYLSPFVYPSHGNIKVIYTAGYTVDNLPSQIRLAAVMLVARLRHVLPLAMEMSSESFQDRSISYANSEKAYLYSLIKPMIYPYRNWSW